jgi:hypothetical protein
MDAPIRRPPPRVLLAIIVQPDIIMLDRAPVLTKSLVVVSKALLV